MMEFVRQILLPVGGIATAVTLPGALELLLVTSGAFRKRPGSPATEAVASLSLAVVVPAHNEEALIGRCVSSLRASATNLPTNRGTNLPKCSVVVVADNCSDATAAKARLAGARVLVRQNPQERGKGYALRFAFDKLMADGFDAFLIVDADSMVSDNLVPEILSALANGADAVQTRYRVAQPLDSESKRLMDVALVAFNVLRPKGRNGWGLSAGILGNGFALSRQTLLDVPYSADSIVEDLEYHLLLVHARKAVRFVDAATVYGDMPTDQGARVTQRARWEGGRVRVALTWIPRLVSGLVRGKLFVAEPLLEILTLPLAYFATLALILLALPLPVFRWYGACLITLVAVHIVSSVTLGGNARQSFLALGTAPAYVIWKLTRMSTIIRSARKGTQWLRTGRSNDITEEVPHV